jgi:hypothetical protein
LPRAVDRLEAIAGIARRALIVCGGAAPSAPPLAERKRRPRVREKTPQPSPSVAALVRRGCDFHFAPTDASAPPASPPDEGERERVRGGESPSSLSLGSQSESSAAVPARTGRGEPITAVADRSPGCRRSGVFVEEKVREWVRGGADGGMRWRKGRLWLYSGRRMRCRWTAGRASVILTASDARSQALP